MSFTVYSRVGNRYFPFDYREDAESFFSDFPGDAILLQGATVLQEKAPITCFADVIKTGIYIQHRILASVSEQDIEAYNGVVKKLQEHTSGLLLRGIIGVGKSTLMKTISMCTFSGVISNVKYFPVIELREIFLAYKQYDAAQKAPAEHKAFELLGVGNKEPKEVCINHVVEEYLYVKNFGQTVNVLGELIEERYAIYEKHGICTHFVTEMDTATLYRFIGERRYNLLLRMVREFEMTGEPKNI